MKKAFLLLALATGLSFSAVQAQSSTYSNAIGLRLGYPTGVTYKALGSSGNAFEGIAAFWYNSFNLTALYEHYFPIHGVPGFQWFIGGGLDVTVWNSFGRGLVYHSYYGYSGVSLGIDLIGGVDYKIKPIPLDVSLDWKPNFYFLGDGYGFYGTSVAISARYTF